MNTKLIFSITLLGLMIGCRNTDVSKEINVAKATKEASLKFENRGKQIVYDLVQNLGDYNALFNKKDVVYTYKYETPDGKKDISTEKYIFQDELSMGIYETHERTLPDYEGSIIQSYDGNEYWLKNNNKLLTDEKLLSRVKFNRPTNYYWFAMFQKLLDPGLTYEYIGKETIKDTDYDIVKIAFDTEKPSDIYQIYVNRKTNLVDQFLFTVADFGVIETPFIMKIEFEDIDGIKIPTKRRYKKSTWAGEVSEEPWINLSWTNIKFNNGLKPEDFKK